MLKSSPDVLKLHLSRCDAPQLVIHKSHHISSTLVHSMWQLKAWEPGAVPMTA